MYLWAIIQQQHKPTSGGNPLSINFCIQIKSKCIVINCKELIIIVLPFPDNLGAEIANDIFQSLEIKTRSGVYK